MADVSSSEKTKPRPNQRRQLWAFCCIVVSLMVLLSLVSYSAADQARGEIGLRDIWNSVFGSDASGDRSASTGNWLSLIGAAIANYLINYSIGYSVIILPILGFVWSWRWLRRKDLQKLLVATNYTLGLGILFSILAGTVRRFDADLPGEWSGVVGEALSIILSKLVGLAGTLILVLGLFIAVFTLLLDLDFQKTLDRLRLGWQKLAASFAEWQREMSERSKLRKEAARLASPKSVEIKKPAEESPPAAMGTSKQAPIHTPPAPPRRLPEKPAPSPEPPAEEPKPLQDLPMEIKEGVKEEEVDLDDRTTDDTTVEEIDYVFPSVELLDSVRAAENIDEDELKANAELLRTKLADFGVAIDSVSVTPGPVVTLYEIVPATGVKISRIESLQDDIALALKAKGIRIIAPIPGKGTVGVEIPNHNPSLVTIRSVINSAKFRDAKATLPLAMGKTISGEVYVDDLSKMPHLLIAGATGSGKSVGVNTIITSLLYKLHPSDLKFAIIDPKKIELTLYSRLRNHYLLVSPDIDEEIVTSANNAVLFLKGIEIEMDRRYDLLASAGVRNIADYNERLKSGRLVSSETVKHRKLPYIIVIVDELADLMITAAREVEEPIARLAQLARAVGIHLVLATQRPSVDVITGVIKANFPARVAYQVASKIDSRTILDMNGADQLLGNGDMLYLPAASPKPIRMQNAFISTDEVERLMNHISKQPGYSHPATVPSVLENKKAGASGGAGSRDDLFEDAARIIVRHQQGSVSLLQRRLKVGYSRAARLVDELESAGIVGPFDGSKAREVLCESEAELEAILRSLS
ncbi:MAG TPA: DNA translocase FtsK 4TM domain-containing protein [Bacteroidota bacterium]|nr:DNA translocase FtsK 4TM domain-containing protein [Bacteroidota bacterium]